MNDTPTSATDTARPSFFVGFLVVACLALTATVVGLVLKNRELAGRVEELTRTAALGGRSTLAPGESFPELALRDAAGGTFRLPARDGLAATLLLVSSDECDYCEDVRPAWNLAARVAEGHDLRVFELVIDAGPEALSGREAPHPLLSPGGDPWAILDRIPGVPAALLFDASGTVRHAFYGAEQGGLPVAVEGFLQGS